MFRNETIFTVEVKSCVKGEGKSILKEEFQNNIVFVCFSKALFPVIVKSCVKGVWEFWFSSGRVKNEKSFNNYLV